MVEGACFEGIRVMLRLILGVPGSAGYEGVRDTRWGAGIAGPPENAREHLNKQEDVEIGTSHSPSPQVH